MKLPISSGLVEIIETFLINRTNYGKLVSLFAIISYEKTSIYSEH
ncbi:hypothetical protein SDC9_136178 [bioreactor metagenome]|jgi:hypothetical protein|uniref:Uncharacterized protein n=1 Tax=bioreactor metagenome TaxID=1076179 RepID=A0A645DHW2_9ZZZZ